MSAGPQTHGPLIPPFFSAHPGDTVQAAAEPPAEASSPSSSTEDFCYVFMVELERGPSGLGMGLIDGMVRTPRLQLSSHPCRPLLSSLTIVGASEKCLSCFMGRPAFGSTDGAQCFPVGHTGTVICELASSKRVHREGCAVQGLYWGKHMLAAAQYPEAPCFFPAHTSGGPRTLHTDPASWEPRSI